MKKLILFILLFTLVSLVNAGTIIVQNTNDSGAGSLRKAVIDAQGGDTIRFNPSLIANNSNDTIYLTSGEIEFNKSLTLIGIMNSTDTLFISGNNTSRIFKITGGTSILDKLAIIDGYYSYTGSYNHYDGGEEFICLTPKFQ